MFGQDFYPTPPEVIERMIYGMQINGRVILEPSAGKGNIVDHLAQYSPSQVVACEISGDLRRILSGKCKVLAEDFLTLRSEDISHVNAIIGNPPFSENEKHILHAYSIAPPGCEVVMLCNWEIYRNPWSSLRKQLKSLIEQHGGIENLGQVFEEAERTTGVTVGMIRLLKPGVEQSEFDGFFMEEEPEQQQVNGLMPYNFIRELVNRYVAAVKLFDQQLELAVQMESLTNSFFQSKLSFNCTMNNAPVMRNDFKKDLQKSAWLWVFQKMSMNKYTTKGLRSDVNKFVETQTDVPFTMRNIYKMLEIVIGTVSGRMDRAIIEVFDKLTEHYDENRYNVEGWKTNSHYLVNEKFIMPYLCGKGFSGKIEIKDYQNSNYQLLDDMCKALCYITGKNYDNILELRTTVRCRYFLKRDGEFIKRCSHGFYACYDQIEAAKYAQELFAEQGVSVEIGEIITDWGGWFEWGFFEIKCYKKGTAHIKFKDRNTWALFNQHVARIKGYPLPEGLKPKNV